MNELIRKISLQAGFNQMGIWKIIGIEEYHQKFAELIIKECEQVSLKNSHRDDDMGAIIARQIKKHFGVEK